MPRGFAAKLPRLKFRDGETLEGVAFYEAALALLLAAILLVEPPA
jgi:hypothetical protein